jgi:hypothetical protein
MVLNIMLIVATLRENHPKEKVKKMTRNGRKKGKKKAHTFRAV